MRARWFDGRSARARPVLLHLAGNGQGRCSLRLHPLDAPGAAPLQLDAGQFEWPDTWEPGQASPRLTVDLRQHGSLEVDGRSWQQALADCGVRRGMAQRLQRRWTWIAAALLGTVLAALAFARWGTPWAAGVLSRHAPLAWEQRLSHEALSRLDARHVLRPTRLPRERQQALRAAFDQLRAQIPPALVPDPRYAPPARLEFRAGLGPNALALPGGTVILTDSMVELAQREGLADDALLGVLAHEWGHVLHRHGTRRIIELGLLNGAMALALGDVSGIVATGSTVLAGLAYSRDHEREADCFAIAVMGSAQRPVTPMGTLLLAAERSTRGDGASPHLDWLSTHPDTGVRAQELKAARGAGCAPPRS